MDIASGVAALIKASLALQHRHVCLPTLAFPRTESASRSSEQSRFTSTRKRSNGLAPADGGPRRAGVSSFGVGGTNAHAVLEEAPPDAKPVGSCPTREQSAFCRYPPALPSALDAATENIVRHLARQPNPRSGGRELHASARAARVRSLSSRDRREGSWLTPSTALERRDSQACVQPVTQRRGAIPPVAFLFPGQGAQTVDMGSTSYTARNRFSASRSTFAPIS